MKIQKMENCQFFFSNLVTFQEQFISPYWCKWWDLTKMSPLKTWHYNDVIMDTIASQITSLTIVYSIIHSDADQRKHQSSPSLAFVRGIHWGPVNSWHKWPVTRKMFPFDDTIMDNILSDLLILFPAKSYNIIPIYRLCCCIFHWWHLSLSIIKPEPAP